LAVSGSALPLRAFTYPAVMRTEVLDENATSFGAVNVSGIFGASTVTRKVSDNFGSFGRFGITTPPAPLAVRTIFMFRATTSCE